jgi:hypothetical protein
MTDDLLTAFRSAVDLPDEAAAQQIYARATAGELPFPRRKLVLAIVVVVGAGAAVLVGFLALPSSDRGDTRGAPATPLPLLKALNEASQSFGVQVILPDTPLLKASDADPTAFLQWLPSPEPGVHEPVSQLNVQFSSPLANIGYAPTAYTYWGSTYPNALDQYKAEIAQTPTHRVGTPPTYQIVDLSDGTPALVDVGSNGNDIEFRLGPLSITIWAPKPASVGPTGANGGGTPALSATDLQALAQSIVDQSARRG